MPAAPANRGQVDSDLARTGDAPCTNAEVAAYPLDLRAPNVRLLRRFVTDIGDVPQNCVLIADPAAPGKRKYVTRAAQGQAKPA